MKIGFILGTLVLSTTLFAQTQAQAATVLYTNILVKGHGGVFKADLIADSVSRVGNSIWIKNVALRTSYGEVYALVMGGFVAKGFTPVSDAVCALVAPSAKYSASYPKSSDASKDQAIFFMNNGREAYVSPKNDFMGYEIRSQVECSSEPIPHSGE